MIARLQLCRRILLTGAGLFVAAALAAAAGAIPPVKGPISSPLPRHRGPLPRFGATLPSTFSPQRRSCSAG